MDAGTRSPRSTQLAVRSPLAWLSRDSVAGHQEPAKAIYQNDRITTRDSIFRAHRPHVQVTDTIGVRPRHNARLGLQRGAGLGNRRLLWMQAGAVVGVTVATS